MNSEIDLIIRDLVNRYPKIEDISEEIKNAYRILENTIENNGKIITCGNGGSFSDATHIVGELLKGFAKNRKIKEDDEKKLMELYGDDGKYLSKTLQIGLEATTLGLQSAFNTAFINDVASDLVFAQELKTIGRRNDTLICISTSGNSNNIYFASLIANYIGMKVILLTGNNEGKIRKYSDCIISVPEKETYKIQELHLPIYHALCLALEGKYFEK